MPSRHSRELIPRPPLSQPCNHFLLAGATAPIHRRMAMPPIKGHGGLIIMALADREWLTARRTVALRRQGDEAAAALGLLVATDAQQIRADTLDDSADDRLPHATHERRVQP